MTAGRQRRVVWWLRRWVGNPIASVVLVVVLVGDAFTLPRDRDATVVGGLVQATIDRLAIRARATDPGGIFYETAYVVKGPAGIRVLDPESQSWGEISAAMMDDNSVVVQCFTRDTTYRSGFWAPTSSHHFRGIRFVPLADDLVEGDCAWARDALFDESLVPASLSRELAGWSDIASADLEQSKILWGGVAHDALALMVLIALLYALTSWPAWFAAHPLSRRARRSARGQCPACGYDLRGLDGGLCPECGRAEPPA